MSAEQPQSPVANAREAIARIRMVRTEAAEIRRTYTEEQALFDVAIARVKKFIKRLEKAKLKEYFGDEICRKNREYNFKTKFNSLTTAQFCKDIIDSVDTAESLILDKQNHYSSSSTTDETDVRLINLCTYLSVVASKFDEGLTRWYRDAIPSDYADELKALYEGILRDVEPFVTRASRSVSSPIPPVDAGAVTMPEDFPTEAVLPIGRYMDSGDEWVAEASAYLGEGGHEPDYTKLIHRIARNHRKNDVLALDLSAATAGNHLLIRQPAYMVRELDDRPDVPDDQALIELFETVICRYMSLYPRISKRVGLIDTRPLSELDSFVSNIYQKGRELVLSKENRDGTLVDATPVETLRMLLSECRSTKEILTAPCRNLSEYNAANYQNGIWKQMTLLVIKDFPLGFDDKAVELLKNILQEGHKYGITVLMSVCDDLLKTAVSYERAADYMGVLAYFDERRVYSLRGRDLISHYSYERISTEESSIRLDDFSMQKYLTQLEFCLNRHRDPAIDLRTLFEEEGSGDVSEDRRETFSKVLNFPIGKTGTVNCNMKLHRSGGGSPHVVIAGTTGSGKSVLLQDIIISAACHYRPDELEMYLFDFKETPKGFDRYKTGFPHVKKIATQCKERDILELLLMIRKIYTERMVLVSAAGYADIGGYNKDARERGIPLIPRMMVIIDEYQTIVAESCLNLLLEIAQKGREYGVVLIMASQSNKVPHFGSIIRQFGHRFEFKNEPLGELINHIGTRAQELNGPKGLCFYSADGSGGLPVLVRCAYVNDEDRNEAIAQYVDIIRRFGDFEQSTYKIGDIRSIRRPVDFDRSTDRFLTLDEQSIACANGDLEQTYDRVLEGEAASENEWLTIARERYESPESATERGFVLRLGLNSISLSGMECKLDRKNPYLLLCGNGDRMKSLEYSVIKSALMASAASRRADMIPEPRVYFIDGDIQSETTSSVYAMKGYSDGILYADHSVERIKSTLSRIREEYDSRRKCAKARDYEPVIIMLSSFDRLVDLMGDAATTPADAPLFRSSASASAPKTDWSKKYIKPELVKARGGIMPEQTASTEPAKTESAPLTTTPVVPEKNAAELLESLFTSDMYKYDMFLCIQMSDTSRITYLTRKVRESNITSFIFLDRRSTHTGDRAEADRDESLSALASFTAGFLTRRSKKMKRDDLDTAYGYRLTDTDTQEFIPYEYDDENA